MGVGLTAGRKSKHCILLSERATSYVGGGWWWDVKTLHLKENHSPPPPVGHPLASLHGQPRPLSQDKPLCDLAESESFLPVPHHPLVIHSLPYTGNLGPFPKTNPFAIWPNPSPSYQSPTTRWSSTRFPTRATSARFPRQTPFAIWPNPHPSLETAPTRWSTAPLTAH